MNTASILRAIVVALGFLTFITLALLIYVDSYTLHDLPPSPTPIDCSKGYRDGMSPEEVFSLMEIPLIELNWLPDDLEIAPQIKPHGLEWVDSSNGVTCVIRITYPNLSIDIISLWDVTRSTLYPVGCNHVQEISGSWIHCSGEFATWKGNIAISIFTTYPLETAQKIAEGIAVVAEDQ